MPLRGKIRKGGPCGAALVPGLCTPHCRPSVTLCRLLFTDGLSPSIRSSRLSCFRPCRAIRLPDLRCARPPRPFRYSSLSGFIGRPRLFLIAVVIPALCPFGYPFIDGLLFFCPLRFVPGLPYGLASPVIAIPVASIVPESRRGAGLGYFTLSITLGYGIGSCKE